MNASEARAVALERVQDLVRIANDTATAPAAAEQARIDALLIADGLDKLDAATGASERHRKSLFAVAELRATMRAYRHLWGQYPDHRPTQAEVAEERRMSERTLVARLRSVGIRRWHDVESLMEPEG